MKYIVNVLGARQGEEPGGARKVKNAPLSMVLDQKPLVRICSDFQVQCRETELGESLWEK